MKTRPRSVGTLLPWGLAFYCIKGFIQYLFQSLSALLCYLIVYIICVFPWIL